MSPISDHKSLSMYIQTPMPAKRDNNSGDGNSNEKESIEILLGVIFGFVAVFILSISIVIYHSRRNRRQAEKPKGKIALNRLQRLELVAPTRNLEEWWPTVKQSLGLSQVMENHFVCVVCLEQVERTQEIHELSCLHVFHKECLERWFLRNHYTCPLCHRVFFEEREKYRPTSNFMMFV